MKAKFSIVGGDDVPQWRRWINFATADTIPPQKIIDIINNSLADAVIPNVSKSPKPQCIIMSFIDGSANYSLRYWLTDPNFDDPTDSDIRLHIFASLKRHGYSLVHPCIDVKLTQNTNEREAQLRAEEIAVRERTLRKIDLFRDLSNEEINHLANTLIYAPFARGSVITHQGAVAHWLYVLIRGEGDVWHESMNQERRHLAMLSAGQVFGEQGLMTGEPRRATVTARTDTECYRIDKASFEQILQSRPHLAEKFAHILMDRNQQLVDIETNPVSVTKEQQKTQLLDNIRRFFRLDLI